VLLYAEISGFPFLIRFERNTVETMSTIHAVESRQQSVGSTRFRTRLTGLLYLAGSLIYLTVFAVKFASRELEDHGFLEATSLLLVSIAALALLLVRLFQDPTAPSSSPGFVVSTRRSRILLRTLAVLHVIAAAIFASSAQPLLSIAMLVLGVLLAINTLRSPLPYLYNRFFRAEARR
jgi:hypothetical protein